MLDALSFWSRGSTNVTAVSGDLLAALQERGVQRVLIALPRDADTKEFSGRLTASGIGSYRVKLPMGLSVNEYAGPLLFTISWH